MAEIVVDVSRAGDGLLRIRWSKGGLAHHPYLVRLALLELHARNVRAALQALVDTGRLGRSDEYARLTEALAVQGYELYTALFYGVDLENRSKASRVQNWMRASIGAGDRLTFSIGPRVHIPWGLIHDQPVGVDAVLAASDRTVCSHFWCEKYSLATHYFTIPPSGTDVAWAADDFGLLLGAHQDVWNTAFILLTPEEQAGLRRLLTPLQDPPFKLQDIVGAWQDRSRLGKAHGLLNFYCHADGQALVIGDDILEAALFEQRFQRADASDTMPPTLVFLGGCQTAIGDLEVGFLEATGGPGYCGFIGTETKIPDLFTLRFMARFLGRFYEGGRKVCEIMQDLRREHWPLSLVFSLCCPHDLQLRPRSDGHGREWDAGVNLSHQRLSSV